MIYNKVVQDCFFYPRHVDALDLNNPFVVCVQNQPVNQLNVIHFYLKCEKDKLISRACFKTNGNPYVIAALEWLCRQIEGMKLEALPLINYQILIKELDIPNNQYPIAIQIENIYKEALIFISKKIEG